jgi:hypothetical protein
MKLDPLRTFQARWQTGRLSAEAVPAAATELLLGGIENEALVWLAGLQEPSHWEVEPLVQRATSQAGLQPLADNDARWICAYDIAARIVDARVSPLAGAREVWQLWNQLDRPDQLGYFVYLAADYGEGPGGTAWFDAQIRTTAADLLADSAPQDV